MKNASLKKIVGTSALALSLTVLSGGIAAQAQDTVPGGTVTETEVETDDDGFDWGWLGLLGLLGLAGLRGRDDDDRRTVAYRDPEGASRTGTGSGPLR
ncbi:WGxxGxxG family protein [Leptolyngbya sp. AN02str]|uniref:WGxxGxxG family protein n=1 Tax=Leptolyngbya sp. AN02str TaxID=3423363 RepID=UPI003D31EF32